MRINVRQNRQCEIIKPTLPITGNWEMIEPWSVVCRIKLSNTFFSTDLLPLWGLRKPKIECRGLLKSTPCNACTSPMDWFRPGVSIIESLGWIMLYLLNKKSTYRIK